MKSEILPPLTRNLLDKITPEDLPAGTYLGGGTAIALWLGHRRSVDLDWFTPSEFNEMVWQQRWETRFGFTLVTRDWQTLDGQAGEVKTALYYYKYPLIGTAGKFQNHKIAGLEDLAAMKLDAIAARGTRRDFVDLYFLAKKFGLDKLLGFYDLKYGTLEERELSLKKSLVYFTEADEEETPDMLLPAKWDEIKTYFLKNVM